MAQEKPFELELWVPSWATDGECVLCCDGVGVLRPCATENEVRDPRTAWNYNKSTMKLLWEEKKRSKGDDTFIFLIWCPPSRGHVLDDEMYAEKEKNCVPMSEYAIWSEVTVSRLALVSTSLQLKDLVDSGHTIFRIKTATPHIVRALVLALHDVANTKTQSDSIVPGEISTRNALSLLAVASALGLKPLLRLATDVLKEMLLPDDTLRAAAFAAATQDLSLLLVAYSRIKAIGFHATERRHHFGYEPKQDAVYYISNAKLHTKPQLLPVAVLEDMVTKEKDLKEPFFFANEIIDTVVHDRGHENPFLVTVDDKSTPGASDNNNPQEEDAESSLAVTLAGEDESLKAAAVEKPSKSIFSPHLRRCYLVRRKGVTVGERGGPACDEFCLYDDHTLQLLVSARGRKGSSVFSLALARSPDEEFFFDASSPEFLAQSTASLAGSRFILRDWGIDHLPVGCLSGLRRRVRAAVTYKSNVLGRVPNSMRVALVEPLETSPQRKVHRFSTRKAIWNNKLSMWTMDFQSRVKLASKKNFQLVQESSSTSSDLAQTPQVKLLFGKVSKNRFSLDFAPPFAPATALFVCLTTFASKLVAA